MFDLFLLTESKSTVLFQATFPNKINGCKVFRYNRNLYARVLILNINETSATKIANEHPILSNLEILILKFYHNNKSDCF